MGIRAKRPCLYPGCNQLTESKYCGFHQLKITRIRNKEQKDDPLRPFYKCARWASTRLVVLGRDPICKQCNRTASSVVHHKIDARIWISAGNDFYDEDNLTGICVECHNAITRSRQ